MIDYLDLLAAPYVYGARGPEAFDCYGLLREVYRRDWNVLIADYPSHAAPVDNAMELLRAAVEDWVEVPYCTPRCAVTFDLGGHTHIGYMLDQKDFIHTRNKHGVNVDSMRSPWKARITGFRQWKGVLADHKV